MFPMTKYFAVRMVTEESTGWMETLEAMCTHGLSFKFDIEEEFD